MTALLPRALGVLCVSLWASIVATAQRPPQTQVAIIDVTVIDVVAGRAIAGQTVVIAGGRITAAGNLATTSVGTGATRVDGRGKFLIPGLIDTHVHLGANANQDGLSTLAVLLSHGVTGVRDAGASAQEGWLVTSRQRAEKAEVLSPRLHVSGMISGRALTRAKLDAPAYAQQLVDRGVDGLRIRDGLTPDDIRAIMSVAITAGTDCLPVCGAGLQDELSLLVGAGLSPAAALRAATSDAARVLGWSERTGGIAPRLDADLVLLDGDPLRDIEQTRRVHAVVVKGRYLDRQALDALSSSAASGRHPTTRQTSAQSGSTRP